MLMVHLVRHWGAKRASYSTLSWLACIARSLRVLRYPRAHRSLCRLPLYRRYVAVPGNDDVFHHLSHRHYLARHLSARERVACVLAHYRFENGAFDEEYRRRVYTSGALALWRRSIGGNIFAIRLSMAPRHVGEGDLGIGLFVGDELLHRMGFSWVDGAMAGARGMIPLVARNQGRWQDERTAGLYAGFEAAFPHNSPAYFCAAAIQGVALAVGADRLACVKGDQVASWEPGGARSYRHAYEEFWERLGGLAYGEHLQAVPVPFRLKPVDALAGKHRKRAAARRANWHAISESACAVLRERLVVRQGAEDACPVS